MARYLAWHFVAVHVHVSNQLVVCACFCILLFHEHVIYHASRHIGVCPGGVPGYRRGARLRVQYTAL